MQALNDIQTNCVQLAELRGRLRKKFEARQKAVTAAVATCDQDIRALQAQCSEARGALLVHLTAARDLFNKPKTREFAGITVGFEKERDSVTLPPDVELRGVTGEEDEEQALRSLANGRTLTVAKLGSRGCMTLFEGRIRKQAPFPVEPVDTTGAGDTFNAGFLHAWLRHEPIERCLSFGAACGAMSTLASGGTGNQPSESQALEFLRERANV